VRARDLVWVFRPDASRPAEVRALAGVPVHDPGRVGPDGAAEVVLRDGSRVRATRAEIVAE
jgi:hypothetical protein